MNTNQVLIELKKEKLKLESDLVSLDVSEKREIEDYHAATEMGVFTPSEEYRQPLVRLIRRPYEIKRAALQEKLIDVKYKYNLLEIEFQLHNKRSGKMIFDSQVGVVRCGDLRPISFHRGKSANKPRLRLFRKLWDERKYISKGVVKKVGESFLVSALATQLEVTEFNIKGMVKGVNRTLKERKFPAEIERKGGILLVVTE